MMHWPKQSPLEERRLENEIRPLQYKKFKLENVYRIQEYRWRWGNLKYQIYLRHRGE